MQEMQNNSAAAPVAIDNKSLAIGVLAITAAILFVGFLMLALQPRDAFGIGMNDRGGDYVMLTQQLGSNVEGVVVIDAAAKRLSVYSIDINQKQIRLLQPNVPLNRLPGQQRAADEKKP